MPKLVEPEDAEMGGGPCREAGGPKEDKDTLGNPLDTPSPEVAKRTPVASLATDGDGASEGWGELAPSLPGALASKTKEPLRLGKGQANSTTGLLSTIRRPPSHAHLERGPRGTERSGVSVLRWSVRATVGEKVPTRLSSLFLSPPCLPRYLCDKVVPGNRVTIMGIYSIKKFGLTSNKGRDRVGVGIRSAYVRVLGIQVDTDGSGEFGLWGSGCAVSWAEPLLSLSKVLVRPPGFPVPHLFPVALERLYDLAL